MHSSQPQFKVNQSWSFPFQCMWLKSSAIRINPIQANTVQLIQYNRIQVKASQFNTCQVNSIQHIQRQFKNIPCQLDSVQFMSIQSNSIPTIPIHLVLFNPIYSHEGRFNTVPAKLSQVNTIQFKSIQCNPSHSN